MISCAMLVAAGATSNVKRSPVQPVLTGTVRISTVLTYRSAPGDELELGDGLGLELGGGVGLGDDVEPGCT